jgi:hypothetical protein
MLSLFLGAGFSKWASNLPLVSNLFDFDIFVRGPREKKKLERVRKLKAYWDHSHPSEYPEKFIAHAHDLMKEKDLENVLWYIVRRLSDPFLVNDPWSPRTRIPMIDEEIVSEIPGVVNASRFLNKCLSPATSGIITTNYDMLVEYALGSGGFNYGVRGQLLRGRGKYSVAKWNRGPVTLSGHIPLVKLHGSVNRDRTGYYTEGRRGITGRALIVAPVPEKRPPLELQTEWDLAFKILKRSSTLIVFGFAFNSYDQAVLNMLRNGGKNLASVLLVNLTSKDEIAKEIWPDAHITTSLPPQNDFHEIDRWLSS